MVKYVLLILSVLLGGWLLFDGVKAVTRGDYTTAGSGKHAGQLGPWSQIVAAVGLDPRGAPVKAVHILLGLLWLSGAVVLLINPPVGRTILTVCSVCSLWYFPFGTLIAIAELVLLFVPLFRAKF